MKFTKIDNRHYKRITDFKGAQGSNQYRKKSRAVKQVKSLLAGYTLLAVFGYVYLLPVGAHITDKLTPDIKIVSPLAQTVEAKVIPTPTITIKEQRSKKLYSYLVNKKSPLAPHAELIVSEADKNDISWTLVVAISGKESSFGKNIKPNSNNAWGVMQWDREGNRSIRSFNSWKDGIKFESALLGSFYRSKMNKGIQESYCPGFECSDTWVSNVTDFQEEINL